MKHSTRPSFSTQSRRQKNEKAPPNIGRALATSAEAALSGITPGIPERWLERDQTQSRCRSESLNSIVHLELVVNIRQMKVNRALAHIQSVGSFLAAVTLCNQAKYLDFALRQPNRAMCAVWSRRAWHWH
jgi:hypothetical protein